MANAAYCRGWRATHPEYRTRQNVLRNDRRRRQGRGDRTMEYSRRSGRAIDVSPIPSLHQGHPLFDAARAIVGHDTSGLTVLRDPLHEDLLSEAVVAFVEASDPVERVRRFRAAEIAWRRITGQLFAGAAA